MNILIKTKFEIKCSLLAKEKFLNTKFMLGIDFR